MEYFSDVRICTTKRDFNKIKKELSKTKSNILDVLDIYKEFTEEDGLEYVIAGWNAIEWYLNYEDIFVIEKTLKKFKAKGIPFKFIRIGELNDDIEQDACCNKNYIIDGVKILQDMLQKVRVRGAVCCDN